MIIELIVSSNVNNLTLLQADSFVSAFIHPIHNVNTDVFVLGLSIPSQQFSLVLIQ